MKVKKISITRYHMLLLLIAFIWTLVCVFSGQSAKRGYKLQVGGISPTRFVADKDIVNQHATDIRVQQAQDAVMTSYKKDPLVLENAVDKLQSFFREADQRILKENLNQALGAAGPEDSVTDSGGASTEAYQSYIYMSQSNYEAYKNLSLEARKQFQTDLTNVLNAIYERDILEEDVENSQNYISRALAELAWEDKLTTLGYNILSSILEPNMIVDEETTAREKDEAAEQVQPVRILKNEKIVDENEIITEEIYSILESLGYLDTGYKDLLIPLAGSGILVFMLFLTMALYMANHHKKIIQSSKMATLLFSFYCIITLICSVMSGFLLYLVPIALFAMLVSILINTRLAVGLSPFVAVIGALIVNGGIEFMVFFVITGALSALMMQKTYKRSMVLATGIQAGAIHFFAAAGVYLFYDKGINAEMFQYGAMAGLIGILSVIVTIGSLPFWEGAFQVITPVSLLELANADNELMRRMMIEAPGTYHHSLVVANLAETAAGDIGGNTSLARAGSYYHDIGKLKYPQYFSENQGGDNPHDYMEPHNSAMVIIQHTKYGMEYANQYKLPQAVKDIIVQHHGTTMAKYFYHKAVKQYGEENVDAKDFRYPGKIPQTKEAAIVMLADTVEAAVRSMVSGGKEQAEVKNFIRSLIKGKADDGQLDECGLTFKDLNTIENSFMKVFQGMYHERVPYPKEEIKKDAGKEPLAKDEEKDADTV